MTHVMSQENANGSAGYIHDLRNDLQSTLSL
jgi:hypothetical protein